MKKSTIIIVLVLLCLNFWANAQKSSAIDITAKGLQLGQILPSVSLESQFNFPAQALSTDDYRGKLLIIDFWATWCGPCVGMFPKMDELQLQFQDKLQFLSVTYQQPAAVQAFLQKHYPKQQLSFPIVSGDHKLHRLFPHVYLPHYVWIDENGRVCAITDHEAINAQQIEQVLAKKNANLVVKRDTRLVLDNRQLLLMQHAPLFEDGLHSYSYFSGYIEGLSAGYHIYPNDPQKGKRFRGTNLTLMNLFAIAYRDLGNFSYKNMVFEVKDSSRLSVGLAKSELKNWARKNSYCFEMVVEPHRSEPSVFYSDMRRLLGVHLPQYQSAIAYRQQKCLALVRTSKATKFASASAGPGSLKVDARGLQIQNQHFMQLIRPLATHYLQNLTLPIIDETGYTGPIKLSIAADMGNVQSINEALKAYDLALVEKIGACPILHIYEL